MTKLLVGASSDTGRVRDHNEDEVRMAEPESEQVAGRGFLAAVADGMGGHERGEVASNLAIETLFTTFYDENSEQANADLVALLKEGFKASNERIMSESSTGSTSGSMGTTMVAAAVNNTQLTIANVGDSRAYLVRAETATQITRDHSLVAEQVASGVISAEEARTSNYRNVITRALGHRPKVEVDIFEIDLLPDDRVVLCSDGVHGHVEPDEVADITLKQDPQEASQSLINLAMERGSTDNVTAAVIWFDPVTEEIVSATAEAPAQGGRRPSAIIYVVIAVVVLIALVVVALLLAGKFPGV
jgi:serine/threonine protein phosphatase PrpC